MKLETREIYFLERQKLLRNVNNDFKSILKNIFKKVEQLDSKYFFKKLLSKQSSLTVCFGFFI